MCVYVKRNGTGTKRRTTERNNSSRSSIIFVDKIPKSMHYSNMNRRTKNKAPLRRLIIATFPILCSCVS